MLHTLEPISELREITENFKTEFPNSSRTDVAADQRKPPRSVNKSIALRPRDSRESSKPHTENTLNLNNSVQGISQRSWRSMKSREFLSKSIDPSTKPLNKSMKTKREEIGDIEMVQQLTETFGTIRKNNQRVVVNFERNRYDFEPTTNPSHRSQKEEISLEKTLMKYQHAKQFFETQKRIEFEKSFEEEIPVEDEQPKEDHDEVERKFYLPVISFKYEKYSERKEKKKIPEKKMKRVPTPSYARAKSSRSPGKWGFLIRLTRIIAHHKEESPVAETRKTPFGGAVAAAETLKEGNPSPSNHASLIRLKPMPTQDGQVSDKKMATTAPVTYKSPAVKYQEFIDNMNSSISKDAIHQKLSEKVRRAQNDIIKKGNFGAFNERVLRAEFDKILSGLGGRNKTIRKGNVIEELRKESSAMPPSYKLY